MNNAEHQASLGYKGFDSKLEYYLAYLPFLAIIAVVGAVFLWAHGKLMSLGVTQTLWQSFAVWWVVGLACAFGWPLRYRHNMQGLWRSSLPQILGVSLTGPFALVLGFPL